MLGKILKFLGLGVLAVYLLGVVVVNVFRTTPEERAAREADKKTATAGADKTRPTELGDLKLEHSWSTDGLTMTADFTFRNTGNTPVKDLTVECTHAANSGTVIDRNKRTIYEVLPAHGKKVVPNFNMGFIHSQAKRSGCEIIDFKRVE